MNNVGYFEVWNVFENISDTLCRIFEYFTGISQ